MRVAAYWVPPAGHPLWEQGWRWLGRDPERGAVVPPPSVDGMDMVRITAEAARYGFHATLKAPFEPSVGRAALEDAFASLAHSTEPFVLRLAVADLDGFLALCETEPSPDLQRFGQRAVTELDACRVPLSDAELARRRRAPLTPRQDSLLLRWGYPYVLEEWRFHLTLSTRLDDAAKAVLRPVAEAWFAAALAEPAPVTELALFEEPVPGAAFRLVRRFPFGPA